MVDPVLLGQVKRKLNITWEDDETTARVEEIIEAAIPDLKHRLGITAPDFDFSVLRAEHTLFLAYCLYEWNHAIEEFADNYAEMIAQVRTQHEVEFYKANSEGTEDAEE